MKVKSQEAVAASGTDKPITPMPNFDKLKAMKTLRSAAFSENQAGTVVEVIDDAQRHLVTKSDLDQAVNELHTDMEKMRLGLRADMESLRADIQADFKRLYWYIPLVMGVAVSILGIISPS